MPASPQLRSVLQLRSIEKPRFAKPINQIGETSERVDAPSALFRELRVNEIETVIIAYKLKFLAASHFLSFTHSPESSSNTSLTVDVLGGRDYLSTGGSGEELRGTTAWE